jgi:hypothetical protein
VGNINLLSLKEYWMRPVICLGVAGVCAVLAIIKYVINRKHRNKKIETLKELKLVLDKLDAAKHEEVYVKRQISSKKEALEAAQELIQAEEEKAIHSEDYSEELKEIEQRERELNEAISKEKWVLEQKKERDIELESQIEESRRIIEVINKAKEEICSINEAEKNIEEIAAEIRNSFGRKLNEKASFYMLQMENMTI